MLARQLSWYTRLSGLTTWLLFSAEIPDATTWTDLKVELHFRAIWLNYLLIQPGSNTRPGYLLVLPDWRRYLIELRG